MASSERIFGASGRAIPAPDTAPASHLRKAGIVVLSLLFLGAAGCSAQTTGSEWVSSADPELVRVASELLPALAERSGLEIQEPVRVERRSRAELEGYLRFKLDEELSPTEAEHQTAVYAALGMVPSDLDLRKLLMELYLEQVAGFYDPDSTALFVMDDQPAQVLAPLMMHELVHAIQDQNADLDAITDPDRGTDAVNAASAAIEGHATLVMFEYVLELQQGGAVDLTTIPNFTEQFRPAMEAGLGASPKLAAAPRIIRESLLFPYFGGAGFVETLWKSAEGGRPAPFGSALPQSTEQVLHPETYLADPRDAPLQLGLTPAAGWKSLEQDGLGEFEFGIMLEEQLGKLEPDATRGWEGDRWILQESETGERTVVWVSVWETPEVAARVRGLLESAAASLRDARVESLEVADRPALVLVVGAGPVPTVSVER